MRAGTVYWITGLSGSGKTTLAEILVARLRGSGRPVVLFDGDILREVFQDRGGFSAAERLVIALRNARLCKAVADQQVDVVCATISLFHECHRWNRTHLAQYREIYVRAPREVLESRDSKGLYQRARLGEVVNMVGLDILPEEPLTPDVVLENDGSETPAQLVDLLWKRLSL